MQAHKSSGWVHRDFTKSQNPSPPFCLTTAEKLSIMEALDHIHVTRRYQEMGSCSVCKKISLKKCSACGTFYCSSECQTYDWPKHQVVCLRQRDLPSDRNSLGAKHVHAASLKNLNDENIVLNDRGSPFTALANQLNKKSASEFPSSKSLANFKIENARYQNKEQMPKAANEPVITMNNGGPKDFKKSNTFDRKKNVSPKKAGYFRKPFEDKKGNGNQKFNGRHNQNAEKPSKTEIESISRPLKADVESISRPLKADVESISRPLKADVESISRPLKADVESISRPLKADIESISRPEKKSQSVRPRISEMEVICTYRDSADRCWVMDVKNLDKYEEIQTHLNENCEKAETITPRVGLVCSCTFADEWFRGKIVSLTPEISVHFIDFGNTAKYEHKVFKKLPDNFKSMPGLAFLIEFEFDESTSTRYRMSDLESVKLIIDEIGVAPDGIPRVKVIEEVTDKEEPQPRKEAVTAKEVTPKEEKRSVMDFVNATSKGMMILMPGEGKVRYGSIVPDDHKGANDCVEKVLNIDNGNASPYQARVGDYVLVVDKEGNDQRGKVFLIMGSTYYVQLIDCGNVISSDNVYPLTEDLKGLIHLGVRVTIEKVLLTSKMEKLETCFFTINGEANSGKWPCTLKDTEYEVVTNVLLEKPVEQKAWEPKYVPLKSESTVEVSYSHPPNSLFLRVVDAETEQKFLDMNMEMVKFEPEGKELKVPPLPGEMCCAKFEEDGCFYRGLVNSVEGNRANVFFVDFGNEQDTPLKDVKPLSHSLKSFPFFAIKVTLSKVSRKPWNNMIKEYIGKLISENVELTLTYQNSPKEGVTLREKVSGVVVNEFIEKARDRSRISNSIKTGSDLSTKSEIYLDDDLAYTTIPSGTKCDVVILHVSEFEFETHHTFWATRAGIKNFEYVNFELNALMSEHCALSAPYEPSYRELCLAEFEGSWYRAICAGKKEGNFKVFFVDFGNVCEVKAASVRKMVQKFVKAPALAMSCIINGHEKLKKSPELTEKVCGWLLERTNTCISGVEVSDYDKDTLLLKVPEVEALLNG